MIPQNHNPKRLVFLGVLVLTGGFTISFLTARQIASTRQQEQKPVISQDTLPKIISKVKNLEIVSATVKPDAASDPIVTIEIKNNSPLAVYYFALTNGTIKKSEYGKTLDGLDVDGDPHVVIQPYGTKTMDIPLINLDGDYPLVLSAAGFSDGSDDGDASVIERMRDMRARNKARRAAEREKAKQETKKGDKP